MKIDRDVMEVLSTVRCDGNLAFLEGQLDRDLYVKVNKVLVALGGKWNRGKKAHVFDGDAGSLLDAAIVAGEVTTHREIGFFPTPDALAAELVKKAGVAPGDVCLEPSCGDGAITLAMLAAGAKSVVVVDIDNERRLKTSYRAACSPYAKTSIVQAICADFMTFGDHVSISPDGAIENHSGGFDRIVMNPPFCKSGLGDHLDHFWHAWDQLKPGGTITSVMPASVTFRQDRRHTEFRKRVASLGGTIENLPPFSFKSSGTGVNTCTVSIQKAA